MWVGSPPLGELEIEQKPVEPNGQVWPQISLKFIETGAQNFIDR